MTAEEISKRLAARLPDQYDTRKGTIFRALIDAIAEELADQREELLGQIELNTVATDDLCFGSES